MADRAGHEHGADTERALSFYGASQNTWFPIAFTAKEGLEGPMQNMSPGELVTFLWKSTHSQGKTCTNRECINTGVVNIPLFGQGKDSQTNDKVEPRRAHNITLEIPEFARKAFGHQCLF